MPILRPLKPLFDAMNAGAATSDDRPVAEVRQAIHAMIDASFGAMLTPRQPALHEQDHRIAGYGGDITVRVYAPVAVASALPCHLNFHGGGFWLGTLDQSNSACRGLVADVGCVVVSVEYRLAPEHKFPDPVEDCYAALLWVVDQADALGIDRSRISVGGASAGGNLAAAVALMARDRGGPTLVHQILEIPVTDLTDIDPPCRTEDGASIASGKALYAGYYVNTAVDAANPFASPLLASDLTGLPSATIMTAEYDPLRAEGEAYAKRLEQAGVEVGYRCWEGQFHGSQHLHALIPAEVGEYEAQIVTALRRAYGRDI